MRQRLGRVAWLFGAVVSLNLSVSTAVGAIQTGDKIDIDRSSAADTTSGAYGVDRTYGGGSGGG